MVRKMPGEMRRQELKNIQFLLGHLREERSRSNFGGKNEFPVGCVRCWVIMGYPGDEAQ